MSWIRDVAQELGELDTSRRSLRKFGIIVGAVFLLIGAVYMWRGHRLPVCILGSIGGFLLLTGTLVPGSLGGIYKFWMGMAFAMGWVVSRVLLVLLFYIIMTSIAIIARIFRKQFLDTQFRDGRTSYWVKRDGSRRVNYEKMY